MTQPVVLLDANVFPTTWLLDILLTHWTNMRSSTWYGLNASSTRCVEQWSNASIAILTV